MILSIDINSPKLLVNCIDYLSIHGSFFLYNAI